MHEKVKDWICTGMRQCIPADIAQHYKQNGDLSGVTVAQQ